MKLLENKSVQKLSYKLNLQVVTLDPKLAVQETVESPSTDDSDDEEKEKEDQQQIKTFEIKNKRGN